MAFIVDDARSARNRFLNFPFVKHKDEVEMPRDEDSLVCESPSKDNYQSFWRAFKLYEVELMESFNGWISEMAQDSFV